MDAAIIYRVTTFLAIKPPATLLQAKAAEKSLAASSATTANSAPNRVRMTMGGAVVGGAVGRGNMIAPLAKADSATVLNQ